MNELKIINKQEVLGKDFKIYGTIEEPLFLAKDVAEWIEHSNVSKMLNTVDDEEKTTLTISYSGNMTTNQLFLTEDGLYEVLMQSRKPIAKAFKKKVKEILKDIRKHGMYATDELLNNPDLAIATFQALKEEREKNKMLKPMAEYYLSFVDRNGKCLTNFRDTAKELSVKETFLINLLLEKKYIYRDGNGKLLPYADKVEKEYFVIRESLNNGAFRTQTLIIPKGRERILRLIKEAQGVA